MKPIDRTDAPIIIALGSNLPGELPSPRLLLEAALTRFATEGLSVTTCSTWWRSAAWPDPAAPSYLNGVAIVETRLGPGEVIAKLLSIERAFGRRRDEANAPRTLDLDLIAHGRLIIDTPDLTVPHPRAADRLFVMGPLAEILPEWTHPVSGKTAAALAREASVGRDAKPLAAGQSAE